MLRTVRVIFVFRDRRKSGGAKGWNGDRRRSFPPCLFPSPRRDYRHEGKVVFTGEGKEARLEARQTAIVFGDGGQQVVVPTFASYSAEGLEGMLMATHKGFETLAVSELDVEHAAVGLDQAEGVEFALVALIIERIEVAPVDLEALAGGGFHAHEGTRSRAGGTHAPQVAAQDGVPAGIASRAQALQDDDPRGVRVLFQQFTDERLESIELAGTRTMPGKGAGVARYFLTVRGARWSWRAMRRARPMLAPARR